VSSYDNENALVTDVKKAIAQGIEKAGKAPRVLVVSNPAHLEISVSGLFGMLGHCPRCRTACKPYKSHVDLASKTLS
jgi:hypothetical protein